MRGWKYCGGPKAEIYSGYSFNDKSTAVLVHAWCRILKVGFIFFIPIKLSWSSQSLKQRNELWVFKGQSGSTKVASSWSSTLNYLLDSPTFYCFLLWKKREKPPPMSLFYSFASIISTDGKVLSGRPVDLEEAKQGRQTVDCWSDWQDHEINKMKKKG